MLDLRGVTQGLPEKINITNIGGVSGGVFKTKKDIESNRILSGSSFLSTYSLPDVQPFTKIVGICGITDFSEDKVSPGLASPKRDGWFFSDFYLFKHLLKDAASDQIWMTCVKPEIAVDKYDEYIHGDSSPGKIGSRRVVLNRAMLSDAKKNLEDCPPEHLLGNALKTIKRVCEEATRDQRPVLILIFGHGNKKGYTIDIGGEGYDEPHRLTKGLFKRAVGNRAPEAGLCLLTTSCYSGGWAINPDLKVTAITAQAEWLQSLAWSVSGTIHQRSCGSPFATAIADMLLRLTIKGYQTDDLDDFSSGPTYAGFIMLIRSLVQKVDPKKVSTSADGASYSVHQPMFSAQDDEWEMAYSSRTGIPLNKFHERWRLLKEASPRQEPPGGEHRFGPGGRAFSHTELMTTVTNEAKEYFGRFPGSDNKAKNAVLHNDLRRLINRTEIPTVAKLAHLRDQIDYRVNHIMRTATMYKDFWNLQIKNCEDADAETGPGVSTSRWLEMLNLVESYPLFDEPHKQGHVYEKGEWYIASCICYQNWNNVQAVEKLDSLVRFRDSKVPGSGVPSVRGTSRIMGAVDKFELNRNKGIMNTIRKYTESTKRRMRSMSPRKSRRKTLPSDWTQENDTSGFGKLSLGGSPGSVGLASPGRGGAGLGSPGRGGDAGVGSPGRGGSAGFGSPGRGGSAGLGSPGRGGGRGGAGPNRQ
ncbi:hypothetical protein VE03_10055 [Pseudogymnoascus sp. 23342-1-I1]|nr:hypothetical protein VE03_10055 [Pseudogymnoascus sp. 23342-1-I1]